MLDLLAAGGRTAAEIAAAAGCCKQYVYLCGRLIGTSPAPDRAGRSAGQFARWATPGRRDLHALACAGNGTRSARPVVDARRRRFPSVRAAAAAWGFSRTTAGRLLRDPASGWRYDDGRGPDPRPRPAPAHPFGSAAP